MIVEPYMLIHLQDLILSNLETWLNEPIKVRPRFNHGDDIETTRGAYYARCLTLRADQIGSNPFGFFTVGVLTSGCQPSEVNPWGETGVTSEEAAFLQSVEATINGLFLAGSLPQEHALNDIWNRRMSDKVLEIYLREVAKVWEMKKLELRALGIDPDAFEDFDTSPSTPI